MTFFQGPRRRAHGAPHAAVARRGPGVVAISTDKAADASSVLGKTKRLVGESRGWLPAEGEAAASSGGLVNAAEAAGAGWLPTYRADRWFPPLIEIDHVLVSPELEVGALETVRVGGSAHLGLIAWVRVG